ncbi:protein held out wings [Trichuris trichiura]|uniref:Protein held out wings n=1 Tax=Trichuris trichiura TaxID=36087 RepID=A0A077Z914_TRITR|nr:protein held out wings [Trichuris trichiura]
MTGGNGTNLDGAVLPTPDSESTVVSLGGPSDGRLVATPNGKQPSHTVEYLAQLLKDKKQLALFPLRAMNHHGWFRRLAVYPQINKVRASLFTIECNREALVLPEPEGSVVTLQEKVYVPVQEYPEFNFVGRILGPRGMTAKQLEHETGCKIMVRGKGSMRDKNKEDQNRGKPNWEHLNDDLHVLIQCEETANRAAVKIRRAVEEVKRLLVPAPDGEDELKRKQLMELAIINGTYRPANQNKVAIRKILHFSLSLCRPLTSPLRASPLGASIILSPTRISTASAPHGQLASVSSLIGGSATDMSAAAAAAAAGLLYKYVRSFLRPSVNQAAFVNPRKHIY